MVRGKRNRTKQEKRKSKDAQTEKNESNILNLTALYSTNTRDFHTLTVSAEKHPHDE